MTQFSPFFEVDGIKYYFASRGVYSRSFFELISEVPNREGHREDTGQLHFYRVAVQICETCWLDPAIGDGSVAAVYHWDKCARAGHKRMGHTPRQFF